ncbi:Ldh family oxidoreductase [Cupriavidus sp. CP313]
MSIQLSTTSLERWTADVFKSCGLAQNAAEDAAAVLVRSELRGYKTHGLTRVPSYVDRLRAGDFNPDAAMTHRSFPGGIVLDADGAMGQIAGLHAVHLGLQALESSASVLVAVQACGHLGALGVYALMAAEAGAFCIVGQRTPPVLAMEGFVRPAIGHNPIAFGSPLPGHAPIVFDVACSVAARGHILLAAREGKPIPSDWALDAEGKPTTDAQRALGGALLPTGGHKGIGIAMMVECLAGAMTATADALAPGNNDIKSGGAVGRQGGFVWLVKPQAFAGRSLFADYMAQWSDTYLAAGGKQARLPGHRGEALEREGRERGITLPDPVTSELRELGSRLGIAFPD